MKAVLIRIAALLLANGVASFHITPVVRPTRLHPKAVTMNEDEPQEAPAAAAPWSTGNAQLDVVVRRIEQEVADAIIRENEAKAASSGGDSAGYFAAKANREKSEEKLAAFRANNASAEERAAMEKEKAEKKAKEDAEKKLKAEQRKAEADAKKAEAAAKAEEAKRVKAKAAAKKQEEAAAKKMATQAEKAKKAEEAAAKKAAGAPAEKKSAFANPFAKKK